MTGIDNVIQAFSAEHVMRLTTLSKTQLSYWDATGFFRPRYAFENRRSPFSRIYSFKDVVGLRTLGVLRNKHKIPLQHLRKVAKVLSQYMTNPWSDTVLYVVGKEVHFKEPKTERVRGVLSRQYVADIPLERVAHDVKAETDKLMQRSVTQLGQIDRNRYIQHNAPVIAGTRIPTKAIWRFREAGYSIEAIIREYPLLSRRDVEAALVFEGKLAKTA